MIFFDYDYVWHDIMGNIGVFLLISSYWGLQTGKLASDGLLYSVINLVVAVFLTINLCYRPNLSSLIIEFFWFIISVYGIMRALHKAPRNKN